MKRIAFWVISMDNFAGSLKKTMGLLGLLIILGVLIISMGVWLRNAEASIFLIVLPWLLILSIAGLLTLTFLMIYAIMMLRIDRRVLPSLIKPVEVSLRVLYPFLTRVGKPLGYDKNLIRNAYAKVNNHLILSEDFRFMASDVMILTPHCLQKSTCGLRVTQNPELCQRCGKCNVDDLLFLVEKYGIKLAIATGGTLARRKIRELKPKAIVAVACERDLISGLQDVRGIPVLAVVNRRPEGPCINTEMDIEEVEKSIRHFLDHGENEE